MFRRKSISATQEFCESSMMSEDDPEKCHRDLTCYQRARAYRHDTGLSGRCDPVMRRSITLSRTNSVFIGRFYETN